jgi:hypothetical protein
MKILSVVSVLCSFSLLVHAQTDSDTEMTMSFQKIYRNSYPALNYTYNRYSNTHDYSGNWDFDGDGLPDKLFFTGNNGAHVYYHLIIVLSSDDVLRDFRWLYIDFPALGDKSELNKPVDDATYFPQFVVDDFDGDGVKEIYISLDTLKWPIPDVWKKHGVNSRRLLLKYNKGKILVENYKPGVMRSPADH